MARLRPRLRGSGSRFQTGLGHISISGMPKRKLENGEGSAQSFIIKWQNEPKFNFKQSHMCFSRKPCRVQRSRSARLRLENARRRHKSRQRTGSVLDGLGPDAGRHLMEHCLDLTV
jgi:hypothetical protein